jgi:hypothetical protein
VPGGGGLRLDGIPDASTSQVHGLGDQGVGHSGCPESLGGCGSDEMARMLMRARIRW